MNDDYGEFKANLMREAMDANGNKVLQTRACPTSGSWHEDAKEWECTSNWTRASDVDSNKFAINVVADANPGDLALLRDCEMLTPASSADSSGGGQQLVVKQEVPLSPEEQEKQKLENFTATVGATLREFQDMQSDAQAMLSQLALVKYSADLQVDVKKHNGRLASLVKLLLRANAEPIQSAEVKKLVDATNHVRAMDEALRGHAANFGIKVKGGKKEGSAKRRKKA